ncbi:MAG: peroxiredoxin family protein [Gammaproteobacteria bacterium]|nr:peroxiredoxin family protein [Gammaproteobacteria bacterium]MCF6362340.1 peroxiredoxin family protein [Gammaproteobacteria bacterium]
MSFARRLLIMLALMLLAGCDNMQDDLSPSGADRRPDVVLGSVGPQVGQIAPDFTLDDTLYTPHTLSTELGRTRAVVLYFNMWCPICDTHANHMRQHIVSDFPNVRFFLIDYVSGSVSFSRSNQVASGYTDFTVLVPTSDSFTKRYQATMGSTVVIDASGQIVRMNEDYLDGNKLRTTLEALP